MTFKLIDVADADGVRTVGLNRPEQLNSLNSFLIDELLACMDNAANSPALGAVVLHGHGKSFCAGADIKEFEGAPDASRLRTERSQALVRLTACLSSMPKTVIVAVHGHVLGAGADIALSSDIVIASADAKFGYPELRKGIVPALVMPRLHGVVGYRVAFDLLTFGDMLTADEALRLGLINLKVDAGAHRDTAIQLAARHASLDRIALADTKLLLRQVSELSVQDGLDLAGRFAGI